MTMTFVVMSLGTILSGLVMRRDPTSGLVPPLLTAIKVLVAPLALLVLATELGFLQRALLTQPLTGLQWLACVGLSLTVAIVVEGDKWLRRRHAEARPPLEPATTVTPARALATAPS
jgi:Ca2+-transporting ATPase